MKKGGFAMMMPGLVSVTFRKLEPAKIVELCAASGMKGIEWGGDIHVPHGNLAVARQVGAITRDAGLEVSSYGSYYHLAVSKPENPSFEKVLGSALELGAPMIRVWAGKCSSAEADDAWYAKVAEDASRVSAMASREDVAVALEYHGGTLTDTLQSALRLLNMSSGSGLGTYWQPPLSSEPETCLREISEIGGFLRNIHIFHWRAGARLPLSEGAQVWEKYLRKASMIPGDRWALLEFVAGDDPSSFAADASTLVSLLDSLGQTGK